jgi:hypothetical protein
MKRHPLLLALLGLSSWLFAASAARAQAPTFPAQSAWLALPCGALAMTDGRRDRPGFFDERDVVGSLDSPAGFWAWDPGFLYLRLRIDSDPAPGNSPKPYAWGFAFSIDREVRNYEWLIVLNGVSRAVEVYRNSASTRLDDPADPADKPPLLSYPMATHARLAVAPDSSFGGDPDYLVTLAVPWSALQAQGLTPGAPTMIWAGTSSIPNALDGDLACHHGGGPARLSEIGGIAVVFDVNLDTDGDRYPDWYEVRFGTDPKNPGSYPAGPPPAAGTAGGSLVFEGGGGCRVLDRTAGATSLALLLLFALPLGVAAVRRARRR